VAVFGARAQWTQAELHSTVHGGADDACWGSEERLVIRLADQLHVELTMLAGLYHAVSFATNALGIQHEAFAPRFPTLPD
jgi:hypothetical protein